MNSVFFSYSHKDEALRNDLETHLSQLKRSGKIESWHDRRITAGSELSKSIDGNLEQADIILLLISADFLASDYCYDIEMKRALQKHEEKTARVIPVILKPCDWHSSPFGKLLATPTDGKPVTTWANIDEAFLDVVNQIKNALPKRLSPNECEITTDITKPIFHSNTQASIGPRSSNLQIPKKFSQEDKDDYLDDSFTYLSSFFENSLTELDQRNPDLSTRFKQIDTTHFSAIVYRDGSPLAKAHIRHGNGFMGGSITYSGDDSPNSYGESLSVEVLEHRLSLKPMGMNRFNFHGDKQISDFTQQGASEYFWKIFMEPVRR